jgi:hypothetical protein
LEQAGPAAVYALASLFSVYCVSLNQKSQYSAYKFFTVELLNFRTPFGECYKPVHCDVPEDIHPRTYPSYLDTINPFAVAQPKVKTHAVMALISTTAMNLVYQRKITGYNLDVRSHPVPIAFCSS